MSNFSQISRVNSSTSLTTMESRATISNGYDVAGGVRSGSTTNLMDLDGSFMKPTIKKSPSTVGQIVVNANVSTAENFHKTNNGTYYFPNGEIFRPRTSVSKRHRPCKINTHPYTNDHHPNPNKASKEHIPRSSSFSSLNSLKSGSHSGNYMTKSQSFTNIKQKNKQSLVRNIRNNKLDTATNIEFHHNITYSRSSSFIKNSIANQKLQSSNITKNGSFVSLADDHQKLSDSNPSSLSNYNLNRSTSATPTTSIETEEEVIDPLDSKPELKTEGENNLSILNELSEENIKPLLKNMKEQGNTMKLNNKNTPQQENQSSSKETVFGEEDNINNDKSNDNNYFDNDSNTETDNSSYYTDASNKQDEEVCAMVLTVEESNAIISEEGRIELSVLDSKNDFKNISDSEKIMENKYLPEVSLSDTKVINSTDLANNIPQEKSVSTEIMKNPILNDKITPTQSIDAEDVNRQEIEGKLQEKIEEIEEEDKEDKEAKEVEEAKEDKEAKLGTVNDEIKNDVKEGSFGENDNKNEKRIEFDIIKELEGRENLENVDNEFKKNDNNSYKNIESISSINESAEINETNGTSFANEDKLSQLSKLEVKEPEKESEVECSPKNSAYYEYPPLGKFEKFMNDDQTVPPRGDLIVLKDRKIRKHERTSSSISSFSSIIYHPESGNSKRQNSPIAEPSHKFQPRSPPLTDSSKFSKININEEDPLGANLTKKNSNEILTTDDLNNSDKTITQIRYSDNNNLINDEIIAKDVTFEEVHSDPVNGDDTTESSIVEHGISKQEKIIDGNTMISDTFKQNIDKIPNQNLSKESNFRKLSSLNAPATLNSKKIPPSNSNMKKSSSLANLKSFMKKIFTPSKEVKKSLRKAESLHLGSETKMSDNRKLFSSSISLTSIRNNNGRKVAKLNENELPDSNTFSMAASNVQENTEVQNFEKLPTIETEKNMFEDLMNVFDERMNEDYRESKKHKIPKFSSEPFLRDDELTRDQIKDQQMKDLAGEEETVEDEIFLPGSVNSASEDGYFDENIKFLQEELMWTSIVDFDNLGKLGRSLSTKKENIPVNTLDEFLINKEEMIQAFKNLNIYEKRNLPIQLKYISQFKDFKELRVKVEYFNDTILENIIKKNPNLVSILKRGNRTSNVKKVSFSNNISISETFAPDMYKRYNKSVTQYTLTEPFEINKIKDEMNKFKCNEMLVHEESQDNTHFFY